MRTVTGTLKVYLSDLSTLTPADLVTGSADKLLKRLNYYDHPVAGWTQVGEATISVTLMDENEIIGNAVVALKQEIQKTQADAEVKCNHLREKINNLLAIEFKPEAA